MSRATLERLLALVPEPAEQGLFLLLDGAADPARTQDLLARCPPDATRCLWQGAALRDLGDVAPWLAALDPAAAWSAALADAAWGGGRGLALAASCGLDALRRALRRHAYARGPAGELMLVRFHDPACLPGLLAAMTPGQRAAFFDPPTRWIAEGPHGAPQPLDREDGR